MTPWHKQRRQPGRRDGGVRRRWWSRAASPTRPRSLGLSPSAVSKLIARLEDRLGVRLLQRTTRRVTPTAEGRLFYERAREILDEIDAAEELVGQGGSARAARCGSA